MIGLDGIGVILIALAVSLMTVHPIHCAIARARLKSASVTDMVGNPTNDTAAADPGEVARFAEELLHSAPFYCAIEQIARIYNQS